MSRLTKAQKYQLSELEKHGPLYVGYVSRNIMRTFDSLVHKGCARVIYSSVYGKKYVAAKTKVYHSAQLGKKVTIPED